MKKILFLTNRFMNIYLDIIHEMQIQGYDVTYIEDQAMPDDPYLIRNKDHTESEYEYREQYFNDYWKSKIDNDVSKWSFDCLFVIEGFSVSSYLIEKLVEYNPNIKRYFIFMIELLVIIDLIYYSNILMVFIHSISLIPSIII